MYVNYATSSGLKTAASQVSVNPGALMGIDVQCPSAGKNVLTIYDSANSSTSGKLVLSIIEADAGMVSINHEYFSPLTVNNGIYVSVSGTGTDYSYVVRYGI